MSFRELRNFKEIMCTLGYPRLISIENFKVPHFELVADILVWLCHRYDKNMEILDEIRTEADRVAFLKSVAEQLLVKARVKLNLKNLYSSNGFAVRELLKIATLLHEAHKNASAEEGDETLPADIGPGHKFADVKLTRSLAADITKYGARLHELLGMHAESKENAARALGKNFDVDFMQRQLNEMVGQVTDQTEQLRGMLSNLEADEANLQQKIDKKKSELDRHQKRLQSLQAVRPAFMDEYERLEAELSGQYSLYVQSWRNMSSLEAELDAINGHEEDRIAENDRQRQMMQRRLREEELRILRGQAKVDERALDEALMVGANDTKRAIKRPGAASTRRDGRGGSGGRGGGEFGQGEFGGGGGMYGGMAPIDDDDESDLEGEGEEEDEESDVEGDGEEEESDGEVSFTHEGEAGGGDDDDELGDSEDGESFGDEEGEEGDDDDF